MRFNIAGAFGKSYEIIMFLFKHRKSFDFTVYDGINNCHWNGGRINRDIYYDDQTIDYYYNNNISIALTFSNPIIDLDDEMGNHLLEKFHKDGNYIIIVNDNLRRYIRNRFPKYKLIRSITGFGKIDVPMSDNDIIRYKRLEDEYDLIVPRSEHIFDKRFTELDMSKYEVMLNDTCIYNCQHYGNHFEAIAYQNRIFDKPWDEGGYDNMYKIEECWLPDFDPNIGDLKTIEKYGENYGMDITIQQINRLLKMGIKHFKISGREMSKDNFVYELEKYLRVSYDK